MLSLHRKGGTVVAALLWQYGRIVPHSIKNCCYLGHGDGYHTLWTHHQLRRNDSVVRFGSGRQALFILPAQKHLSMSHLGGFPRNSLPGNVSHHVKELIKWTDKVCFISNSSL